MFGFNSKLLLSPYGCRRAHSTAVHGIGLSVNNIIHECLGLLRIIDTVRRDEFVTVISQGSVRGLCLLQIVNGNPILSPAFDLISSATAAPQIVAIR